MFNYDVNKTMHDDKSIFDNLAKQCIADLMVSYDRNRFFLALAQEEMEESFKSFENNDLKENLILDYHITNSIRLITTLDDILIRVRCFTLMVDINDINIDKVGRLYNGEDEKSKGLTQDAREYFEQNNKKSSNKKYYPNLPDKSNRKTRDYRNKITHEGLSFYQTNHIEINGLIIGGTQEFMTSQNKRKIIEIIDLIKEDTGILDKEQQQIDNIIQKHLKLTKFPNG
ncbi:hypothetical protein BUY00_04825 [Staphylococcus chromogenes]|uniref:hypothetical protein n=1 Tax=Staphylococcus chromogenes TaxID=46126 RepID=UPI000D1C7F96|nr:hypothetical protein [Staphylococcus chromogenes]PUZ21329.1 hypothetical protein BUY00_04825 [Staphylococcus chromogenes]